MENLQEVLNKEVTRREFLMQVGVTLLAVVGITGLLRNFRDSLGVNRPRRQSLQGYGVSTYSGLPSQKRL